MSPPATTTPKPAPGDDPLRAFRDEFVFPTFRQMKADKVSAELGARLSLRLTSLGPDPHRLPLARP